MRPDHTAVLAALPLVLASPLIAQDEAPKGTVEVIEVTVRKKPKTPGVRLFGEAGLEIKVAAATKGSDIIALQKDATVCTSFQDDKGTDLKAGMKTGFFHWAAMQRGFGTDRKDAVSITIKTEALPAKDAGRAKLKGTLALLTAAGTDAAQQKLALEKGTKVTAGPVPMTISKVEESSFGSSKLEVQFQSSQSLDSIQKIEFLDAEGRPIKTENRGSGRMGFAGKMTYSKTIGLHAKVAEATVKVTFYKDQKVVKIPLDLDIGIGW